MKSTPSLAASITLYVLIAVSPRWLPIKSLLYANISRFVFTIPRVKYISPRIIANVVFPHPGEPVIIVCIILFLL